VSGERNVMIAHTFLRTVLEENCVFCDERSFAVGLQTFKLLSFQVN
jgi:hypothetical protein